MGCRVQLLMWRTIFCSRNSKSITMIFHKYFGKDQSSTERRSRPPSPFRNVTSDVIYCMGTSLSPDAFARSPVSVPLEITPEVRLRVNSWSLNWQLTRPGFLQVEEVVKVENGEDIKRPRVRVAIEHEDIIRDNFWTNHPYILSVASNHRHVVHRSPTSWMTYLEHILLYFIHC